MTFEDFRDRLQKERVEFYNYFHDHTWGDDYTKIFIYSLPNHNSRQDLTRQARFGAHFVIKRFCDFGTSGIHIKYESKRSVYTTQHTEIVNDKLCFVIKKDVLDTLSQDNLYTAYVLFETEDSFAEMIEAKELKKEKYIYHKAKNQQGVLKYYYPVESFPLHKKDKNLPKDDISYFQPMFMGQYRFTLVVHGHKTNVHVYNGDRLIHAGHFDTITEFYRTFRLDEKGAKLISIQRMYAKKQNFTFKGLTFIFDESWETVEYKIRLSKKQKELIAEIEEKKKALAQEEPEEEEIVSIPTPEPVKEDAPETMTITNDMSLDPFKSILSPKDIGYDEEDSYSYSDSFDESINIFDLPY